MLLLRDRRAELEEARTSPFGVSRDSPWSHVAWRAALDLDVPLLSDWNGEAVHAFGVAHEWRGLKEVAERSAFLVDGGRTVRWAKRYSSDDVPDVDELLTEARALA